MTDSAARLLALRAELDRRGLDGFVVPRADEHQGEYVAPYAQRLAWLTGFTGSAGAAVVLKDRAAVFVDGRYTLQVKAEVDTALYQPLHLVENPPSRWLGEVVAAGAKIGFDPWLHTADQVEALRAACARAGAELVACPDNPVDAVRPERPDRPRAPVAAHPVEFAGRSSREKRVHVADALKAERLDAAVLSAPDSVAWLLNIRGADVDHSPLVLAFAILHVDASVDLFLDPGRLDFDPGARVRPPAEMGEALDALAARRVRVDAATCPAWVSERLKAAGATLDKGQDPCATPKACKNPVELAGMRAAHRRDGAALTRFLASLAPGLGEIEASDRLERFRAGGEHFRGLSFPTISGAGANGAIVHYRSTPETEGRLQAGQLYLVDSGAQYLDGTTDVTRTVAIGTPGEEERRRFTLVLKGHIALARAVFPIGTTGSQLDVLARAALWAEGLDYDHGTGHGVGSYLSVHEGPQRIAKMGNTVALKPGMVLSNEPGYYKAGAYGIRIENLVAVTELPERGERPLLGFETLTLAPIDLALVERPLLADAEAEWLDAYHARVRAELAPLVDDATRAWLERATRPIA